MTGRTDSGVHAREREAATRSPRQTPKRQERKDGARASTELDKATRVSAAMAPPQPSTRAGIGHVAIYAGMKRRAAQALLADYRADPSGGCVRRLSAALCGSDIPKAGHAQDDNRLANSWSGFITSPRKTEGEGAGRDLARSNRGPAALLHTHSNEFLKFLRNLVD
jgi:hypothetical protein